VQIYVSNCLIVHRLTGYLSVCGAMNLYLQSFVFSDKLYKEIRDLNFEVVVQVFYTDFNSF
jgi:hypothetical protein